MATAVITNMLTRTATISAKLPFRVSFINIGVKGGYGPNNPPPIGIAVIGENLYIA